MSFMQSLTFEIISSFPIFGPLISPAKTTLFVVVKVSQATLEKGSFEIYGQQPYQKFYRRLYPDDLLKQTACKKIIIIWHFFLYL